MKADAVLKSGAISLSRTQQDEVREQVARILASSWFRNSKRFPDFLRYTVEHALIGDTENIKERTLGIEIFGREPSYDTNMDSVVRVTAIEVRKRLAQYYQAPGHEGELRIDFSLGSYVPEFVFPAPTATGPDSVPTVTTPLPFPAKLRTGRWSMIAIVAACCLPMVLFLWSKYSVRETALDRFWDPVIGSRANSILFCIPDMSNTVSSYLEASPDEQLRLAAIKPETELPVDIQRDKISFTDASVLMQIALAMGSRSKTFRLFHAEDVTLDDLKQGPAVLVGGMNNLWINQLSGGLRFTLANEGSIRYISDRQNPSSRQWADIREEHPQTGAAYGIISRVFNPATGEPIVIAAGVRSGGTKAAGECLADVQCITDAAQLAPGDWKRASIQFVVQAPIVNGSAGHAHVIAAYLWQH